MRFEKFSGHISSFLVIEFLEFSARVQDFKDKYSMMALKIEVVSKANFGLNPLDWTKCVRVSNRMQRHTAKRICERIRETG